MTDEVFKMRIKELVCPILEPEMCIKDNAALPFEEENASAMLVSMWSSFKAAEES